MVDLAFYNAGCSGKTGLRKLVILPRRLIRRILRPIFLRQVELFQSLCDRLDALERHDLHFDLEIQKLQKRQDLLGRQLESTQAMAWDFQELQPRLANLEDRIEALMVAHEREHTQSESVRFPTLPSDPARARAS